MTSLILELALDNAVFREGSGARVSYVADRVSLESVRGSVRDMNGNMIGIWEVTGSVRDMNGKPLGAWVIR